MFILCAPVGPIVAARVTNNDNALIGLTDPALFTKGSAPGRLDLPCGNYYLTAITQPVTVYAHGHTALYIGGNVDVSGNIVFTLAPNATFDIFVGGTITSQSGIQIGNENYPALTRTYVAGGTGTPGTLSFTSGASLAGNLYYGAGPFDWSSGVDAYGAICAGNFTASSEVKIHYDRQVTQSGQGCPPAVDGGAPGCGSCKDCNNQACINGTCGMCTDSSQCCPPLICSNGTCVLPIQ